MTIQDPAYFQKIGSDTDAIGAAEISTRRVIGGGFNEVEAIAENSHALWTEFARSTCSGLTTYGDTTSGGAPFFVTSQGASPTAYEEIGQIIFSIADGRDPITVYVDHEDCDVSVELYDNTLSLLDSGTTASSGRTQASISLNAGSDTDLRLYVKIRRNADPTDGSLYSLRVEEAKATVADFAGADFKRLDDAAYAEDRPVSPFLMRRVAANYEAAYGSRLRRAGTWWPDEASTGGGENTRPVLASNVTRAWPLTVWPVGVGVSEIEVRLWCTVSDASVSFGLATYDPYTRQVSELAVPTTQATTASPVAVTVSVDVAQYQGQDVVLLLLVRSADSATTYTKSVAAGTYVIQQRSYLNGMNTGFSPALTWDPRGKRYKLEVIQNPASPYVPEGAARPHERMVLYYNSPTAHVSPLYSESDIASAAPDWAASGNYQIEVTEIGLATLRSIEIRESDTVDQPSLANLYLPWTPITAYAVGGLYGRQRRLWMGRPRILHSLWGYDPDRTSVDTPATHFGEVEPFEDDSGAFKEMGAALIGGYDASKDPDGNTDTRMRLRVRGLLSVVGGQRSNPGGDFVRAVEGTSVTAEVKVQLSDWNGSDWDTTNVVTSSTIDVTVPVPFHHDTETAWLTYAVISNSRRGWHSLRGACNPSDLVQRRTGWVPFELTVDDTQAGATYRMCRIMIHGSDTDDQGNAILGRGSDKFTGMWLVGWNVSVDRIP